MHESSTMKSWLTNNCHQWHNTQKIYPPVTCRYARSHCLGATVGTSSLPSTSSPPPPLHGIASQDRIYPWCPCLISFVSLLSFASLKTIISIYFALFYHLRFKSSKLMISMGELWKYVSSEDSVEIICLATSERCDRSYNSNVGYFCLCQLLWCTEN